MSDNSEANIAIADTLTLILYNQHAIAAAIEEVTKWISENGVEIVAVNAMGAMETLDRNARAIFRCNSAPAPVIKNFHVRLSIADTEWFLLNSAIRIDQFYSFLGRKAENT